MKKILMSAAVCAMLLGTSCQNEDIVNQASTEEFTLKLDMGANSRTMMSENGPVWGNEEELYVVGDGGKSYGTLRMVWKSSDGKSAMFSGKITGDASKLEHMVYPKPVDNKIQMTTLNGTNYNAPMVGSIEDGEVTGLGYTGGLVRIELDGVEGAEIQNGLTGSTKVIGGYYQFNPIDGTIEFKEVQDGKLTITNIPDDGVVYIPVHTTADQNSKESVSMQLTKVTSEGDNAQEITLSNPIDITANVAKNALVESEDDGFVMVGDKVEEIKNISTLEELKTAVADGGYIKLNANLELSTSLVITKETAIDLAGYSIKDRADGFTGDALIIVDRGGNLTIKDSSDGKGMIWAKTISVGIKMTQKNEKVGKASLTVDGGTIKALEIAISGNGQRHNTEITINGGVFETLAEESVAIYHPQDGTLTINGGLFDADWAAVEMRAGTLAINGGEFIARYRPTSGVQDGSGSTIHGAAIAVSQHSTHKPITVNITDGTFVGHSAFHEEYFEGGNYTGFVADGCSFNIAGGKFIGNVYSENFSNFINGGEFTDLASAVYYAKENAEITLAENTEEGEGFKINKNITIDLNEKAYGILEPLVGSSGTEKNGLQILYGADKSNPINVTIKNGVIHSGNAKFLIQNYSNLTLTDVIVDLHTSHKQNDGTLDTQTYYALSNNNGNVTLNGSTEILVPENEKSGEYVYNYYALDVCDYSDYCGVKVTINTTGKIQGDVEVTNPNDGEAKVGLNVISGTIIGKLVTNLTDFADGYGITIDKNADVKDESWNKFKPTNN